MHSLSPTAPVSTFVIRFWVEWSGDSPFWRGSIEHLQSGKRATFQDLGAIHKFIQKYVGNSSAEPTSQGNPPF